MISLCETTSISTNSSSSSSLASVMSTTTTTSSPSSSSSSNQATRKRFEEEEEEEAEEDGVVMVAEKVLEAEAGDNSDNDSNSGRQLEDKIKQLMESPILNQGLSPRLSRMMRLKQQCSSPTEFEEFEPSQPPPPSESVSSGSNLCPSATTTTANPTTLSSGLRSSARALAIFNASASPSSTTNNGNSSTQRGSLSALSATPPPSASSKSPNVAAQLRRTASLQTFPPVPLALGGASKRATLLGSSLSRGSALLRAAGKGIFRPPLFLDENQPPEVEKTPAPGLDQNSGSPPQTGNGVKDVESPRAGILKSPGEVSRGQKRRVIFTEPVVSSQIYFDSSAALAPTIVLDRSVVHSQTLIADLEPTTATFDISVKRQKLDGGRSNVIVTTKHVRNDDDDDDSKEPEEEEGGEEFHVRCRHVAKNYQRLFEGEEEDGLTEDGERSLQEEEVVVVEKKDDERSSREDEETSVEEVEKVENTTEEQSDDEELLDEEQDNNSMILIESSLEAEPEVIEIDASPEIEILPSQLQVPPLDGYIVEVPESPQETLPCHNDDDDDDVVEQEVLVVEDSQSSQLSQSNVSESSSWTSNAISRPLFSSPRALSILKAAKGGGAAAAGVKEFESSSPTSTPTKPPPPPMKVRISSARASAMLQAALSSSKPPSSDTVTSTPLAKNDVTPQATPRKSILRQESCTGSARKRVVFSEPVVSSDVRFDAASTSLVICTPPPPIPDSPSSPTDSPEMDFSPLPQQLPSSLSSSSLMNTETSPHNRKPLLCHQNSTFGEDCDTQAAELWEDMTWDLSQVRFGPEEVKKQKKQNAGQEGVTGELEEEEEEEEDGVQFEMSTTFQEFRMDFESSGEASHEMRVSTPPREDETTNTLDYRQECKSNSQHELEEGELNSQESYDHYSVFTQKFPIKPRTTTPSNNNNNNDNYNNEDEEVEKSGSAEMMAFDGRFDDNNGEQGQQALQVRETNEELAQHGQDGEEKVVEEEEEEEDEEEVIVNVPMPLSLARQFYHYLGRFLQEHDNKL